MRGACFRSMPGTYMIQPSLIAQRATVATVEPQLPSSCFWSFLVIAVLADEQGTRRAHLSLLACLLSGRRSSCLPVPSRPPPAAMNALAPPASPLLAPSSTAAAVMPKSPRSSAAGASSPRGDAEGVTSRAARGLLPRGRRLRRGVGARPPSESSSLSDVSLSLRPCTKGTSRPAASFEAV